MVQILRPQSATARARSKAETYESQPISQHQPVRPLHKRNTQRIRPQSAIATSKVLKEEIAFQRQATVQGHAIFFQLQATLCKKKKELYTLQQRLQIAVEKNGTKVSTVNAFQPLKDEIARQEMYIKRLKFVIDDLERQNQMHTSMLKVMEETKCTLERELGTLESKLMQERNAVAEWDRRRKCVADERELNRHHWMIGWTSMQHELECRKRVFMQRQQADQQRLGIMQIIHALPSHFEKNTDLKKVEHKEYTPLELPQDSSLIEAEYDRLLSETNEVHGQIVLDRFRAFETSRQHFNQTEKEMVTENDRLRMHCDAQNELIRDLETSLIAPLSEIKQTESLTEQLASISTEKTEAKNKFLQSLRSLSRIQQGIQNTFSLLQCLEPNEVTELDTLDPFASMLCHSLTIALRIEWSRQPLTEDQSLQFSQIVPEYGTSEARSSILDSRFQLTNGSNAHNGLPIAIQRLRNASKIHIVNEITPHESIEEDEDDNRQMRHAIKLTEHRKLKEIQFKTQKEKKALTHSIDCATEKGIHSSREPKACA